MSNENEKEKQQRVPSLPHRENITMSQFNTLLSAMVHTTSFINASKRMTDDDGEPVGGPRDGGALAAAETTVIKICDRLDTMLSDNSRWDLGEHRNMEKSVAAIYAEQARSIKAQADAYEEISSPHHRYKPKLVKMMDGSWLAFAGNPQDLDNAMCGVGDCPEKALEAFDALFKGKTTEQLKAWIAARESQLKTGQNPDEVIPSQTQNEKSNLDPERNNDPENPARKRRFHKRYRPNDGQDPEVGGESLVPK